MKARSSAERKGNPTPELDVGGMQDSVRFDGDFAVSERSSPLFSVPGPKGHLTLCPTHCYDDCRFPGIPQIGEPAVNQRGTFEDPYITCRLDPGMHGGASHETS